MEDMMFMRGLEKNRSEQPPSNPLKAMCWILLGKGKFVCVHVGVRRLRGETCIFFSAFIVGPTVLVIRANVWVIVQSLSWNEFMQPSFILVEWWRLWIAEYKGCTFESLLPDLVLHVDSMDFWDRIIHLCQQNKLGVVTGKELYFFLLFVCFWGLS